MDNLKFDRSRSADRLFALERSLIDIATKFDLALKPSKSTIYQRLIELPQYSLARIEFNMWALQSVLIRCQTEQVDPWDDKEFLVLSMRALGLSFPRDFMDKMHTEDLVEGYDQEGFQIFRNLRFMETSSYSLLEIQSYEWTDLFQRSQAITDKLMSYANDLLWENNCTVTLDIPEHFICEIKTATTQTCSVLFKKAAPIFYGPNRRFGLLVSCQARVVNNPPVHQARFSVV